VSWRNCSSCGEAFDAYKRWYRQCWHCWRQERDDELRQEGFDAGYRAGLARRRPAMARTSPLTDPALLRDLVSLVHPDRHPPERTNLATQLTALLLGELDRCRKAA
jgi:hypothetical protein